MFTQGQIDELNVLILNKKQEFDNLIKEKGKSDELSNNIKESIQGFISQHIRVYEKEVGRYIEEEFKEYL